MKFYIRETRNVFRWDRSENVDDEVRKKGRQGREKIGNVCTIKVREEFVQRLNRFKILRTMTY